VTLTSSPPGLRLELDGQPFTAPQAHTGVAGIQRQIAAPSPQIVGGRIYLFQGWSDGGRRPTRSPRPWQTGRTSRASVS